jgi:magnesium-transporting ATPase (P-type)
MSFEKAEKGILTEKPRNPKESLFNGSLIREILVSSLVIASVVFAAWWVFLNVFHMDTVQARSYAMCLMVFIQNVHVFNCRSEKRSAFSVPITKNPVMLFGIAGTILLQVIVMEVPFFSKILRTVSIPPLQILGLFGVSLIILVVMELYKQIAGAIASRRKS